MKKKYFFPRWTRYARYLERKIESKLIIKLSVRCKLPVLRAGCLSYSCNGPVIIYKFSFVRKINARDLLSIHVFCKKWKLNTLLISGNHTTKIDF